MQFRHQEKRDVRVQKTVICLFGAAFAVFIGTKLYPLIHGPDIQLKTMSDGAHLTEPMIQVSGTARFTKDLTINGVPLPTAPNGSFDEAFLLNPGYNVITMEGKDHFGNATVKNYAVILTEEPDRTFTLNIPQKGQQAN
jgi:hypothetical protein